MNNLLKIAKKIEIGSLKFDIDNGLLNSVPFIHRKPNGLMYKKEVSLKPVNPNDNTAYTSNISGKSVCISNYTNLNTEIIEKAEKSGVENASLLTHSYFISNNTNQELFTYVEKNKKFVEFVLTKLFNARNLIVIKNEKQVTSKESLLNKFPNVKGIGIRQNEVCHSFKSIIATDYPCIFVNKEIIQYHDTELFFENIFNRSLMISLNQIQEETVLNKEFKIIDIDFLNKFRNLDYVSLGLFICLQSKMKLDNDYNQSFFKIHEKNINKYSSNISNFMNDTVLNDMKGDNNRKFEQANRNIMNNIHKHFLTTIGENYIEQFYELDNVLKDKIYYNGKKMDQNVLFTWPFFYYNVKYKKRRQYEC